MAKYVQINAYSTSWADSIIFKKHRQLLEQGHDSYVFWGRGAHEQDRRMRCFTAMRSVYLDALLTRIDGRAGFHSKRPTRRLLRWLDEIDPDVIHLHVLCGYYVNVELIFEWLASHRCRVVWTLHDCWAFTGHCIYFTEVACMQWRTHCVHADQSCPQRREYPETFAGDKSVSWCFERKRQLFTMLPPERMSLITPSRWLADLVQQSFLAKYDVEVVRNEINADIFKPTPSDFRKRYGIGDRFMVLGVAGKWSKRKGLDSFMRLACDLDPTRFAVVVVGVTTKQARIMPDGVVCISHTASQRELAEIYTAADVHVQPSIEETFGMTVSESQACGTSVIVRRRSACEESADSSTMMTFSDYSELRQLIESTGQRDFVREV